MSYETFRIVYKGIRFFSEDIPQGLAFLFVSLWGRGGMGTYQINGIDVDAGIFDGLLNEPPIILNASLVFIISFSFNFLDNIIILSCQA